MQPLLSSAQFDFQGVVIILALIASFFKWLWETWQEKRAAAQREQPTLEERSLRDAAWRRQTGRTIPPPIPSSPPLTPVAPTAMDELRKAWKEIQTASQPPQPPRRPASAPAVAQRQSVRQVRAQPPPSVAAAMPTPSVAPAPLASFPAPMDADSYSKSKMASKNSLLATLQNLRRDPALMRQAILMQEILGPPKALQSSNEFAI